MFHIFLVYSFWFFATFLVIFLLSVVFFFFPSSIFSSAPYHAVTPRVYPKFYSRSRIFLVLIRVGEIPSGFFKRDLSLYKSLRYSPRKSPDLVQRSNTSRFYCNSITRSHGFQTAEFLKPGTKLCTQCTEVLIPDFHEAMLWFILFPFLPFSTFSLQALCFSSVFR